MKRVGVAVAVVLLVLVGIYLAFRIPEAPEDPEHPTAARHTRHTPATLDGHHDGTDSEPVASPHLATPLTVEVRARGEPAPGATVELNGRALDGKTDEQGRLSFTFDGEDAVVQATLGAQVSNAEKILATRAPKSPLLLGLRTVRPVRGVIVGTEDGLPIAGATIKVDQGVRQATTDAQGRFAFEDLSARDLMLDLTAPGYCFRRMRVQVPEGGLALRLTMPRAVSLAGKVVDLQGQPINVGVVKLLDLDNREELEKTDVDAKGGFAFRDVYPQSYLLRFEHETHARAQATVVAPTETALLRAGLGGEIGGTVTGPDGRPLAGAHVQAKPEMAIVDTEALSTTSDEKGHYSLQGLSPGRVKVAAEYPGLVDPDPVRAQVPEEGYVPVDLRYAPSKALVRGTVVDDATQQPLTGVRVQAVVSRDAESSGPAAMTDDKGRFLLAVEDESKLLQATNGDHLPAYVELPAPGAEVTLKMKPRARLKGRVVSDEGAPIHRFNVQGEYQNVPDGRFDVARHPDDKTIRVRAEGCEPVTLTLPDEGGKDFGDIVATPSQTFTVRTRDERGAPLAGTAVYLVAQADSPEDALKDFTRHRAWNVGVTDADGQLAVALLADTAICVVVNHPTADLLPTAAQRCPGAIKAGDVVEVSIPAGGWVQGHVRRGGKPTQVLAITDGQGTVTVTTDPDGFYRLGPLAPGLQTVLFTLGADDAHLQIKSKQVQVEGGHDVTLDLDEAGGGRLTVDLRGQATNNPSPVAILPGTLAQLDLTPLAQGTLPAGMQIFPVYVDDGVGQTVIEDLAPGPWTVLWINERGHAPIQAAVTVALGRRGARDADGAVGPHPGLRPPLSTVKLWRGGVG